MIVIVFFIITYVFFFTLLIIGFFLLLNKKYTTSPEFKSPSISIIVSLRNEYNRINSLLKSLDEQSIDLNNIELIFVDDHSNDDSFNKLNSWASTSKFKAKVVSLKDNLKGKKNAIIHGVSLSKSDYILCFDADISFNSKFLSTVSTFLSKEKDFYILPVVENSKGNVFSIIESYMLSLVTMGSAKLKFPLLSNGAAMLFKRSCFNELNPFDNNHHVSSGDDIFILQSFKNNNKSFDLISPTDAFLFTEPSKSYGQYINRAIRWSGKMKFSDLHLTKLAGLLVLFTNYIAIGLLITFLFTPSLNLLLLMLPKFFIDFLGLLFMVNVYGNISLLAYSPLMLLFYPFHLLILFAMSFFNLQKSWKGRPLIEK